METNKEEKILAVDGRYHYPSCAYFCKLNGKCYCDTMETKQNWEDEFETLRKGYEEVQMVQSSIENAYPEAYRLARKFHELYEQQAPFFGYITNPNSREFYPNSNNGRLMAYVCYEIVNEERKSFISHERHLAQQEILQEIIERVKNIGEQNHITQAILASMEYRGFYDCGKYLDGDIWEAIKPIILEELKKGSKL